MWQVSESFIITIADRIIWRSTLQSVRVNVSVISESKEKNRSLISKSHSSFMLCAESWGIYRFQRTSYSAFPPQLHANQTFTTKNWLEKGLVHEYVQGWRERERERDWCEKGVSWPGWKLHWTRHRKQSHHAKRASWAGHWWRDLEVLPELPASGSVPPSRHNFPPSLPKELRLLPSLLNISPQPAPCPAVIISTGCGSLTPIAGGVHPRALGTWQKTGTPAAFRGD